MTVCSYKRVALSAALFLFSATAISQQKKPAVETSSAIIERAQNLLLQGDRHQALSLLNRASQKEKPSAQSELRKASFEMSRIFLSDKAQQAFEVALSMRRLEPAQAQARLLDVLKVEPENTLAVLELAQVQILRNECSQALDLVEKSILLLPFDEELQLAQAQALLCLKRKDHPAFLTIGQQIKKSGPLQIFWILVDIESAFLEPAPVKAKAALDTLAKADPQAPQISYWKFRLEENKKNYLNSAQKYVMSCKNMTAADYRKYSKDPLLCRNLGELENEIKSSLAQQE